MMGTQPSLVRRLLCATLISTTSLFVGCGSPDQQKEDPLPVKIELGKVKESPNCTCADAAPYFATNTDSKVSQTFRAKLIETNKSTKVDTTSTLNFGALAPLEKKEIGCSVWPNENEAGKDKCGYTKKYTILNWTVQRQTVGAQSALFGSNFSPTIAACQVACENPNNPYCLDVGQNGKALFVPFAALVDGVWTKESAIITNDEILSKYKISPSDDKCKRGDTAIDKGVAINKASDGKSCLIIAKGGIGVSPKSVNTVKLTVKPVLTAQKVTGIRANGSSYKDIEIPTYADGSFIEFDGIGSDTLNEDFAGNVRYVSQGSARSIIVTSRGCLSIPN